MDLELTKLAIKTLRGQMCEWRTPEDLKAMCSDFWAKVSGAVAFNKGGLTFITEATVAADIAIARHAARVRLVPDQQQPPDFELAIADRIERFEMVQADKNGRRRGDEHKALALKPPGYLEHYDPPGPREIIEIVATAARKKAKPYPSGTQLLIYLNADMFPSDSWVVPEFAEAVADAKPFFSDIWITWQGELHRVWS